MNIVSHQPGHRLTLRASRTDEALDVAYTLRAVLLWPLVPLWLLWTLLLSWRRNVSIGTPLRLREVTWDGRLGRLHLHYGFWPLILEGRKTIGFERVRKAIFSLSPAPAEGQRIGCRFAYGAADAERSVSFDLDVPALEQRADAEEVVYRIARLMGWRRYQREAPAGGAVRIELSASSSGGSGEEDGDEGASDRRHAVPTREQSAELRAARGGPAQRRAKRRKLAGDLSRALGRHLRCRVVRHRPGRRVELYRGWDGIALVFLVILALPLLLVPAAFVTLAVVAFLLVPAVLLQSLGLPLLGTAFYWYAAISAAVGALAIVFHEVLVFLRDYGPRRVRINWSDRVVQLTHVWRREAVPFEDIVAVVPRGEWQDDRPPGGSARFDTRVGLEIARWGNREPLRVVWVGHTRKQSDEAQDAVTQLGQHLGQLLGVPCRPSGFREIETGL